MEEIEYLATKVLVFSDIYQIRIFCDSVQLQYVSTAT